MALFSPVFVPGISFVPVQFVFSNEKVDTAENSLHSP